MSLEDVFDQVPAKIKTIKNEMGLVESAWTIEEFSSFCPATGFPDYARIEIFTTVEKGGDFIEQKEFRNWLNLFRNVDAYQEEITAAISKLFTNHGIRNKVIMYWKGRGGISNEVCVIG